MLQSLFLFVGVCLGIGGEAFFAAAEISLVVSNKITFLDRKEKQAPEILPLLRILSYPQRISYALLVGSVLSAGISTFLFIILALRIFPEISLIPLILLLLGIHLPLLMVFGEIIPRVLFYSQAEETAIFIARPLEFFMTTLRPVITLFHRVQNLAGKRKEEESPFVEEEDLEWIRRFAQGSEMLRKEEIRTIRKIFDFSDIRVRDILVPLDHVVSVSEDTAISDAIESVFQSGFTRLPVFRGEPERIVGMVHALDLLRAPSFNLKIENCSRNPFFVNPDTLIRDLFKSMQKRGVMMSVVLGDDGVARGIVTMEDIMEEIFGEIEDEFDLKDQLFREISEKEYLVNARVNVQELNEQLHLRIPSDGYKTLGGYILHHLRRIPQEGERFTIGGLMFKIELADEKQIYKLFLRQLTPY